MLTAAFVCSALVATRSLGAFGPSAEPDCAVTGPGCPINSTHDDYCKGTKRAESHHKRYVCGDPRLGPVRLPTALLATKYDRLGGYCPGEFLKACWNGSARGGAGDWKWPAKSGFQVDRGEEQTDVGLFLENDLLDRFGGQEDTLFADATAPGTALATRSIPASVLNTPNAPNLKDKLDCNHPWDYHLYRVKRPLAVEVGRTAAWFGQPGGSLRVKTPATVDQLVSDGSLELLPAPKSCPEIKKCKDEQYVETWRPVLVAPLFDWDPWFRMLACTE